MTLFHVGTQHIYTQHTKTQYAHTHRYDIHHEDDNKITLSIIKHSIITLTLGKIRQVGATTLSVMTICRMSVSAMTLEKNAPLHNAAKQKCL
jgi:hypothetical protein